VPAVFEAGRHPGVEDRERFSLGQEAFAKGYDVGIVMRSCQPGRLGVPAQAAAHARHAIGDDRLAVAGAAQNDFPLAPAAVDDLGHGVNEEWIVAWLGRMRAEVANVMALPHEMRFD
jgi:hypothetical protein